MGQTRSLKPLLAPGRVARKDLWKEGPTVVTLSLHEDALSPALGVWSHGPLPALC